MACLLASTLQSGQAWVDLHVELTATNRQALAAMLALAAWDVNEGALAAWVEAHSRALWRHPAVVVIPFGAGHRSRPGHTAAATQPGH